MRRVCSWCGKEMETKQGSESDPHLVSHSACDDCAFNLMAQQGVTLRQYLNKIGAPVFVVDKDNRIVASNTHAADILKKDFSAIDGILCGDVFECDHARMPEGCGKTVHCSGCTVRICIQETIKTGESFNKVPAYLDCAKESTCKVHFLVSTEKFGNAVLLKLEDVSHLDLHMEIPD